MALIMIIDLRAWTDFTHLSYKIRIKSVRTLTPELPHGAVSCLYRFSYVFTSTRDDLHSPPYYSRELLPHSISESAIRLSNGAVENDRKHDDLAMGSMGIRPHGEQRIASCI